jgi:WD40 repeat protein
MEVMKKMVFSTVLISGLVLAAPMPQNSVSSVVSPDGQMVWVVTQLTDAKRTEQQVTHMFDGSTLNQDFYPGLETDTAPIAAFSSNGSLLAYGNGNEIAVLDFKTKRESSRFVYPNIYKMAFFSNTLLLAARGSDFLQVSSVAGKLGAKFKVTGVGTNLEHLSVAANGKLGVLLVYSKGATFANIVDFTKNAKTIATVAGLKTGSFTACAVNATASSFICGADEGSIAVFNASGKITRTFKAFKTAVQSVVFTKNGSIFASSASSYQTFK